MRFLRNVLFLCILGFVPLSGQEPQDQNADDQKKEAPAEDKSGSPKFWQAELPGGEYMVALDQISSISKHSYILDGALIVNEVTIDTTGQALARFYYIKPITSQGATASASDAVERTAGLFERTARSQTGGIQDMVVKKYPVTTHAKTIEYRLLSDTQLDGLYQSAKKAWEAGKGRIFMGR